MSASPDLAFWLFDEDEEDSDAEDLREEVLLELGVSRATVRDLIHPTAEGAA